MVHLHAMAHKQQITYIDLERAFLHAPEKQCVVTEAPEGWRKEGMCWRLKRKINGRRDGTKEFGEWFSVQLLQAGWRRSVLHPSCFTKKIDGHLCCICTHVDDGLVTAPVHLMPQVLAFLMSIVLL